MNFAKFLSWFLIIILTTSSYSMNIMSNLVRSQQRTDTPRLQNRTTNRPMQSNPREMISVSHTDNTYSPHVSTDEVANPHNDALANPHNGPNLADILNELKAVKSHIINVKSDITDLKAVQYARDAAELSTINEFRDLTLVFFKIYNHRFSWGVKILLTLLGITATCVVWFFLGNILSRYMCHYPAWLRAANTTCA